MNIADTVWNAMGWCPMEAAVRRPATGSAGNARIAVSPDDGSPVARRSARYMRLAWGLILLSWGVAFLAIPHLPEIIPVHWGLHGEANGFADRLTGALGMPVITTILMIVLLLLPRSDSARLSLAPFRDSYAILILATVSMCFCIETMAFAVAMGISVPVATIISVLMGFLFIVLGSLMPTLGRNTTMGFRLPWTLASDEIWRKTHEHGGPVFMGAGMLIVLGSLVAGFWAMALMLMIVVGASVYITVWSYRLAKKAEDAGA